MKVTPQMMAKLENCKSANDILELAKQKNISLTFDQAQKAFDLLQSEDISDEDMLNITGGWRGYKEACPNLNTPMV